MKILLTLCKNELLRASKINQIRYTADTKERKKTMLLYLLIFMIAVGLIVSFTHGISGIFSISWVENDIINSLIVPMVFVCLTINIAISIFWGSGLLLSEVNADAQLALPVRLSALIVSRLFVVYLFLAVLDMLLLFPMDVLFGITAGIRGVSNLINLGNILLLPILPCLLGVIIGTGIYRMIKSPSVLIARLKTILAVLLLFAFIAFMFLKFPDISKGNTRFSFTATALHIPVSRYVKSLLYHNMLSLAVYWGAIPIASSLLLHCLMAVYQNWYCNSGSRKEKSMDINSKMFTKNSIISALIIRERRRYFSIPAYFTNTALGFLLAITFVMLVAMANEKIVPYVDLFSGYFQIAPAAADILYIFAFTIFISLSNTTYASISIEGKQMEVLNSLPVNAHDIFKAKIGFHLSLAIPVILILNTIMALSLHFPWHKALLGYIMPLAFTSFAGVTGYILNLVFPDFEWNNVTHIVKQSFPAIISTVFSTFATCGTAYLLLKYFSDIFLLGSFIACIVIFLMVCVMLIWLKKYGEYIYQKL